MAEGTSIDDILSGDEPVDAPIETEAPADGPERDEHGRFVAKTGVEPAPEPEADPTQDPVPPTDKLPKEDYKAIREEREKRQALERELEALKQQFQASQQPPAPPPSIWEDEQGFVSNITSEFQKALYAQSLATSERLARIEHGPDLVEKARQWGFERCNADPQFNAAVAQSGDPIGFAVAEYKKAENYAKMQELGATDVADLEAKLREKIMAELQEQAAPAPDRPGLPPTLATERNVGSRAGPAWSGPTPLSDLLG